MNKQCFNKSTCCMLQHLQYESILIDSELKQATHTQLCWTCIRYLQLDNQNAVNGV